MTRNDNRNKYTSRHRITLAVILCFFGLCVWSHFPAKRKTVKAQEDEKIYLLHADELYHDMYSDNPEAQIAKGHVRFRHKGGLLWCDSAYFYQLTNSVKAFGNVRYKQGDTLSLTCLYADYDGQEQKMAARHKVVLTHNKRILETDSLNFDRLYNYAYFEEGGTLKDGRDRLVSDWGRYNLDTKEAVFYYNVKMKSDDMLIETDTLYYDTKKSLAHVVGPNSTITSKESIIKTEDAYYDSKTEKATLFQRSTVTDKQKSITGDSLYYTKNGDSLGYGNVVYIDQENKNALICDEMQYNETTGCGFATKRAVLKDFSQSKDTLYAHADTIRLYTFNINTDSVYRKIHCYNKVRVYRVDVQAISDSVVFNSQDSCMTMYHDPIVWNGNRQLLGEKIKVYMNDSTIRRAHVIGQALSIEQMPDSVHFNQVSSKLMTANFLEGVLRQTEAVGNVRTIYYPVDDKDSTLIGLNYLETDTMRMYLSKERQLERIWTCKFQSTLYPITQIPPMKEKLDVFAWFDGLRPINKDDIFVWRGKRKGEELSAGKRHEAPLQKLD